jgi:hypothetical protein
MQKFAARISSGTVLERIIATFILLTDFKQIFLGTDASGFKPTNPCVPVLHRKSRVENKWDG